MMHNYYYGLGNFGPLGIGWIFMVLFSVAVFWLIFSLIRSGSNGNQDKEADAQIVQKDPKTEKDDLALSILRERYAKGEITREQFLEKKHDLS
jgi:putative membrane protein